MLIDKYLRCAKPRLIHIFSTVFCAILLSHCQQSTRSKGQADRTVLRMNIAAGLTSLDPAYAGTQANVWLCTQLYEGLVGLDAQLKVVPALAHSWQISPDGLTYTFHLKTRVRYHPDTCFGRLGTRKVRAQDFVYCFTRICDPATTSSGAWLFADVVQGADSFRKGLTPALSGFRAKDDSTLFIRLVRPYAPFLTLLTMPYATVVAPEAIAYYGKALRQHPVGTGPFRFKSWRQGKSLILLRNEAYHVRGLPKLDALHFRFIPGKLTAFIEFTQGRLDFLEGLDVSFKDEILQADGQLQPAYRTRAQLLASPQLTTEYVGFRLDSLQSNPALRDARVRRALSLAIDRAKLVRYLYNTQADAANFGFVPLGLGTDSLLRYPYDPALAAKLLAEAGYPEGRGIAPLVYTSSPSQQALSEFLQQSWQAIGLKVTIENLEGAAAREQIANGRASLWRANWVADYPDAENFFLLFGTQQFSPGGPNTTHYHSPLYDVTLAQFSASADHTHRPRLQSALEEQLAAHIPVIPLFYYRTIRLAQPNLHNLPQGLMPMLLDLRSTNKKLN
jgi:oligopeptide transport system substrate-binding protein